MSLALDRPEFAPPPQRGTPRAVLLALVAHALLIIALTWGVSWRRETADAAVDAELWSSTVQQAAPRAVAPTPPPPAPAPAPAPEPPPPPPPPPPPQAVRPPEPAPPPPKEPDIALEREKKLKEQKERERQEELAREQRQKKLEAERKAAQEKKEQEARERAERLEAERKKEELQEQREQQQKKLAEAKKKEAEAAAKKKEAEAAAAAKKKEAEAKAAAQAAADRAATLKRMQAMAGTGGEGNAARSSGPSGSYAGKVAAAVRPNVVFPEADLINGNPGAEFDVRLAPDGTIVGTPSLVKSSGVANWDEAALRALQKTEKLPRDVDGTVPSRLIVTLRPKR
jgi:colicin import membrane protein